MVRRVLRWLGAGRGVQRLRRLRALTPVGTLFQFQARHKYLNKILNLVPINVNNGDVEVHMLLNKPRLYEGMWGLYSFVQHCEETCTVVVHDDGTLGVEGADAIQKVLPGTRVVRREESDAEAEQALANHPRTARLRETLIFTLKIVDPFLFSNSSAFALIDSDVLMFRPFSVKALMSGGHNRYSLDIASNYCTNDRSVNLVDRFNPGVLMTWKNVLDLDFVEHLLRDEGFWTPDGKGHYFAELTLWAALLARAGATPLPEGYAICPDPAAPETMAGHYCGGDIGRTWFYTKGLPLLLSQQAVEPIK